MLTHRMFMSLLAAASFALASACAPVSAPPPGDPGPGQSDPVPPPDEAKQCCNSIFDCPFGPDGQKWPACKAQHSKPLSDPSDELEFTDQQEAARAMWISGWEQANRQAQEAMTH